MQLGWPSPLRLLLVASEREGTPMTWRSWAGTPPHLMAVTTTTLDPDVYVKAERRLAEAFPQTYRAREVLGLVYVGRHRKAES